MHDCIGCVIADGALGVYDGLGSFMLQCLVALIGCIVCTWLGIKLIRSATRRSTQPPIPPARVANLAGKYAAYAKAARVAARAGRMIGKARPVIVGLAFIVLPWLYAYFWLR